MYRYILRESCSQFDSLPLTSLTIPHSTRLSYTSFEYSDVKATDAGVTFTVKNSGAVPGAEVAQLYLGFPAASGEPPKQLKGFTKIQLAPGASTTVTLPLNDRSLSIWDVAAHDWAVLLRRAQRVHHRIPLRPRVSVLLCTVTYYANRAHNLTRSP